MNKTRLISACVACAFNVLIYSPFASAVSTVSKDDQDIMNQLARGSTAEVQLGQLVEKKATNPAVKDFGKRMAQDHSTILKQLDQWAANHKTRVLKTPTEKDTQVFKQVSALSGEKFDEKYIQAMLKDHKKDVAEVANYIDSHQGSSATSTLKGALPILEDHLRIAENVAGQIGVGPEAGLNQTSQTRTG